MSIGLIGRKLGMTRVFNENGKSVPVTVIQVEANRVTQLKNLENDGYTAIQVTTGERKASRMTKAEIGHFAKSGVQAGRGLWEFRLNDEELASYKVGDEIKVDAFQDVKKVDVTGQSKVRVQQVPSSVTTSYIRIIPTVTHVHIVSQVLQVRIRPLVEFSRARRWLVIWVLRRLQYWALT